MRGEEEGMVHNSRKRPAVIRWLVTGLSRVNLVNDWINQFLSLNASVSPTDVIKKAEHYNQRYVDLDNISVYTYLLLSQQKRTTDTRMCYMSMCDSYTCCITVAKERNSKITQ